MLSGLSGLSGRIAHPRLTVGVVGGAVVLALTLLAVLGLPSGALAQTPTYASCSDAQTSFPSDLAAVSGSKTFNFPADCTVHLSTSLSVPGGTTVVIDGNGLILDQTRNTQDVIDIDDSSTPGGTLTLDDVTVENGHLGVYEFGSGATLQLIDGTTILHNGFIGVDATTIIMTDSTLSANSNGLTAETSTVTDSTVSANGIGIYSTALTVTNSTITGNTYGIDAINQTSVIGSTITDNTAEAIVPANAAEPVSLTATLLAGNGTNCDPGIEVTDAGYNRSTDSSCSFTSATSLPNGSDTTPPTAKQLNLLPLGNYGGPTQTIALGPGSTAIDQIPTGTSVSIGNQTVTICPSATDPAFTDQRGIPRPQGNKCDIGAYEAPALSLTVSPNSPNGTNGWYTSDPTVTLGYSGLAIGADSTGAQQAQVASCSGLSHTATTLNDRGTVSFILRAEGTTAIGNCGVRQGTTPLGFSTSGKTLFLYINVDTIKPTASASAKLADGGAYTFGAWTNQAVTVTLTANDDVSGVEAISYTVGSNPTQTISGDSASFTLSGQGTYTISYWATDNAGNVSTTHSVEVDIDLHAPGITITSPQAQAYALKEQLTAGYTCLVAPGISPVTQCSATVTLPDQTSQTIADGSTLPTTELGSYTFVVNAENAAGNTSSRTVTYTVGYALTALPGDTTTVRQGYDALIRFAPEDANGHDYASRTLTVTSVELDGPNNQVIAFAYPFRYGTFNGKPGYQLTINTRNLSVGTWTLVVQIGAGAQATTGTITFTVE